MAYALVLNSSNVIGSNNNTFQYNFIGGSFVSKDSEIAISSVTIPYSWYNISSQYNNQNLTIVFPLGSGTTALNLIIPAGFYTVPDIQNYINQQCIANNYYLKDNAGNYVYYFYMTYSSVYYKVQVLCSPVPTVLPTGWSLPTLGTGGWSSALPTTGYIPQLVLYSTFGNIGPIIGFANGNYPTTFTTTSQNFLSTLTPVGSTVNSLVVRCSLVKNAIGVPTDILDSIPINSSYGGNINYVPSFERYVTLADGTYSNFQIVFSDQNLNTLYALDPNVSITLLIKKKGIPK